MESYRCGRVRSEKYSVNGVVRSMIARVVALWDGRVCKVDFSAGDGMTIALLAADKADVEILGKNN